MNRLLMYNEEELAKKVLENGFENKTYNYPEALLIAKYYRHVLGYKDARLKTEIRKFCVDYDPYFYPVPRRGTIRHLVKKSKYLLVDYTKPIEIRQIELDQIKNIKNFKLQQIALAILSIVKRNFDYDRGYLNKYYWKDVRLAAGYWRVGNKEIQKCFSVMKSLGMIKATSTNAHEILFIDSDSRVIFQFTNDKELKSLGSVYREYCGGEVAYCLKCGKEIVKNSNRHKMCDECWKEKEVKRRWFN